MNVQLYNRLLQSSNFFKQMDAYDKQLKECESHASMYDIRIMMLEGYNPKQRPTKKLSIPLAVFLTIFLPLIGILYIVITVTANNKNKNTWNPSKVPKEKMQEYEELKELANQARKESNIRSQQIRAEQTNYYNNNYQHCFGYLPQILRNRRAVEDMLHYVKTGQANTLDQAWALHAQDLRELEESRQETELQEERRKQHAETVAALKKISEEQEQTNRELETMRQIRRNRW